MTDTRWDYSNYGKCVDIYAPGVAITSAMYYTPTSTLTASGTSMACPHVSGAVAQYLQLNPNAAAQEVRNCARSFACMNRALSAQCVRSAIAATQRAPRRLSQVGTADVSSVSALS